jgi:hypothetical protein
MPKALPKCHGNQVYHELKCRTPTSDAGKECSSSKHCQSICAIKGLEETKEPHADPSNRGKKLGFCFGFLEYQDACTQYLDKANDRVTPGICSE